jgi:hypothetical protein
MTLIEDENRALTIPEQKQLADQIRVIRNNSRHATPPVQAALVKFCDKCDEILDAEIARAEGTLAKETGIAAFRKATDLHKLKSNR